jgi:cytochrome c
MVKGVQFFFATLFIVTVLYSVANFAYPSKKNKIQQENHPPLLKIIAPKNNSPFDWNTQMNYTISVSDKEDGESKYEEINPKEVLLKVKYAGDISKITAELNKADDNSPGLTAIRTSNCLNCHNFDGKLIGPSFNEISKRYPATSSNIGLMVKRTREGSKGVWGKVSMPTHPELTKEETKNMIEWILKNASNPNIDYYIGTEGSFRLKQPVGSAQKGAYILTASYTDHGLKEGSKQRLEGQDVVVISSR